MLSFLYILFLFTIAQHNELPIRPLQQKTQTVLSPIVLNVYHKVCIGIQ